MDPQELAPAYPSPAANYADLLNQSDSSDWTTASDVSSTHNSPVPTSSLSESHSPLLPPYTHNPHSYFSPSPYHDARHPMMPVYPPLGQFAFDQVDDPRPELYRSVTEPTKKPARIPRPPNAFMLFRSDFLKSKPIPEDVEKRQQNLSRVAGEVWNLLPDLQKKRWQDKAAVALADHQVKFPSYKFTPAPRTSAKTKPKIANPFAGDDGYKSRTRMLREKYVSYASGPAVAPARKRKQTKRKGDDDSVAMFSAMLAPLPPSPASSCPPFDAPLLPAGYSRSLPPSRPTSSLSQSYQQEAPGMYYMSGMVAGDRQNLGMPDFDATPTAANFPKMQALPPNHQQGVPYSFDGMTDMQLMPGGYIDSTLGLGELRLPPDMQDMSSSSYMDRTPYLERPPYSEPWNRMPFVQDGSMRSYADLSLYQNSRAEVQARWDAVPAPPQEPMGDSIYGFSRDAAQESGADSLQPTVPFTQEKSEPKTDA